MPYIMGVDIGTGSCKAVIFDEKGKIVALSRKEYPTYTPYPGWAEQDPDEIRDSTIMCIREAILKARVDRLDAISFSAQGYSMMAVDANGRPLTSLIIWQDTRSKKISEEIRREYDAHELYKRTGCPITSMYLPSKILWLKRERPDLFGKASKIISIKEYVIYDLIKKYVVDLGIASASGLLNTHNLEWDEEILEIIGISTDKLSEVASPYNQFIIEDYKRLGLSSPVPLVLGSQDGVLSNVGTGAVGERMAVMIGTSGAVRMITNKPVFDKKERTWCYVLDSKHWVSGGAVKNGGLVYRWFRDTFCEAEKEKAEEVGKNPYELINTYVRNTPPGAGGLVFLPYLTGAKYPIENPFARGVVFGLSNYHTKAHLARAIMEGVTLNVYHLFKIVEGVVGKAKEIIASGGFVQSSEWLQILADIFGREIHVSGVFEGSALGAAIVAMISLKIVKSVEDATNLVEIKGKYLPDQKRHKMYSELFELYTNLYWKLQEEFEKIVDFQDRYPKMVEQV